MRTTLKLPFAWILKNLENKKEYWSFVQSFIRTFLKVDIDILDVYQLHFGIKNFHCGQFVFGRDSQGCFCVVEVFLGEVTNASMMIQKEFELNRYLLDNKIFNEINIRFYNLFINYKKETHFMDYIYEGSYELRGANNNKYVNVGLFHKKERYSKILNYLPNKSFCIISPENFNKTPLNERDEWVLYLKNDIINSCFKSKVLLNLSSMIAKGIEGGNNNYVDFIRSFKRYKSILKALDKEVDDDTIKLNNHAEVIAIKLIQNKVPIKSIAFATGFTIDKVKELKVIANR